LQVITQVSPVDKSYTVHRRVMYLKYNLLLYKLIHFLCFEVRKKITMPKNLLRELRLVLSWTTQTMDMRVRIPLWAWT